MRSLTLTPARRAAARRTTAATVAVVTGALVVSMCPGGPAAAASPGVAAAALPAGVSDVRLGLIRLGDALARSAEQPALSADLPLTELSVRDVLRLDSAIGSEVATVLSSDSGTTLDSLDDAFDGDGPLTVEEVASPDDAPADSRDWTLAIDLGAAVPAALTYEKDGLELGAAEIDGELAGRLTGTLRFRYDPDEVGRRRFSVVGSSDLTTRLWTRSTGGGGEAETVDIAPFTAVDTFIEVDASGTARVDTTTDLRLRDPNGRGLITTEDLEFSDPAELFTTTTPPGADDVAMRIDLDSDLDDDATGSVVVGRRAADAPGPYAEVPAEPTRSAALEDLTSLTRLQALTGLTQYAGAVKAAESTADQEFPLLDLSVSDLYSPGTRLLDLLTEQATAAIVCGAADTSPPTGAPRPGQVQYCQATTSGVEVKSEDLADGEGIVWEGLDEGVTVEPAGDATDQSGTVGREPTANVAVSGGDGFPQLRVGFTTTDGTRQFARTTVASIQDLGESVADLGLDGGLDYDREEGTFEVRVRQQSDDSEAVTVPTGGNGGLAPLTGLSGLCQAQADVAPRTCPQTGQTGSGDPGPGQAEVSSADREFHADFGIGMTGPTEDPEPGEPLPPQPVFYLKPGTDGELYRVGSVSADLAQDAAMVARIGFLQVDVDVTDYAVDTQGPAAAVSVDTTDPVTVPSTKQVTGAVTLDSLLTAEADQAATTTVERGLSASADLLVQASEQELSDGALTRPLDAQGTVAADWSDLRPGALPRVETAGRYDDLRLLDLVPSRQSTMGPGTGDGVITDPTADFVAQFGVDLAAPETDRSVTRQLYDLGVDGSTSTVCTTFVVVDATTLRCDTGPLAADGAVAEGHGYVVNGDPDALRDVLIEDLAAVYSTFTNPDPALGADRTFPLVDVLPGEISAARDGLGAAVVGLQEAATAEVGDPGYRPVGTLQDFSVALDSLLGTSVAGGYTTDDQGFEISLEQDGSTDRLVLGASLAASGTREAPLRVASGDSEVRVVAAVDGAGVPQVQTLPVATESAARFVVGVDLADASSQVRGDTGVTERIAGFDATADSLRRRLAERRADVGSALVSTGAAGDVEVGLGVESLTDTDGGEGDWVDLAAFPASVGTTRQVAGDAQTCGPARTDGAPVAACLELPLEDSAGTALDGVQVALGADETSGGSGGAVSAQPIAYRFLTDGLGALSDTLAAELDGDQTDVGGGAPLSLPLVGTDLDAGADVPADVTAYVNDARRRLASATASVKETDTAASLETALQGALDATRATDVTATGVDVTLACGTTTPSCAAKTVASVQTISVPLTLTGSKPAAQRVPFHVGPAGASVETDMTVPATTTWTLDLTVGVARGKGSFVDLAGGDPAKELLTVDVDAALAGYDAATNPCHAWKRLSGTDSWQASLPDGDPSKTAAFPASQAAGARCIDAFVGKLPAVLLDRPGGPDTALDATVTVAPGSGQASGPVYLPAIHDGDVALDTEATGTGNVSVYFESFASQVDFFDVLGTIDLAWTGGAYTQPLQFGQLRIDVTTLNNAILPGFDKAKKWLAPLNPVVDTLTRPIPVVTELSEVVGKGPVTLLTLLQQQKTPINLVLNLLQLQNLVAGQPTVGAADLRPIGAGALGGFVVPPSKLGVGTKCTETVVKDGVKSDRDTDGDGSSGKCKPGAITKFKQAATDKIPPKDAKGTTIEKTSTRSPYLSLPSVSLPLLQDTSQVFDVLLDSGDATMLYVDLGHVGVSKTVVKNFGPFAVGPVPVSAQISGTAGLDGRFGFGFDTRGLSRAVEGLDNPGDISGFDALTGDDVSLFSDGFYIDDLENGVDVPEISLSFTISAGAAVSIGFAEAGIRGGVTLDLALNAYDPNGDGKIYSDEFAGTANGPQCAFDVSSGIAFFLQFYFSLDLVFYTFSKSFDIVRSPRLTLFESNCTTEDPVLAKVEGAPTPGNPDDAPAVLHLTMGAFGQGARGGYRETRAEKYIVRQLGSADPATGGVVLQVSAFNLVQNFAVASDTIVKAEGDDGADTVRMYPVAPLSTDPRTNEPSLPDTSAEDYVAPRFTSPAVITGGDAADSIETGDGDDSVTGGAGNDAIATGAGRDTVTGDSGTDRLDGGQGRDSLSGGTEDDRVNGGAGADEVRGGEGDDVLDGGVGSSPDGLFGSVRVADIAPLLDTGDTVVGDAGSDTVTGGDGSDVVVGGGYTLPVTYESTMDVVVDADDEGIARRVAVNDLDTTVLPQESSVRTQCATEGTAEAGDDRDDVTGGGARDYVLGGASDDTLSGGAADDLVCGRGGDDVLHGDGPEVLAEEQGEDEVRGGPGRDRLYGAGADDTLLGDADDDLVRGGDGDDGITGGGGADLLLGEAGLDTLTGDGDGVPEVADDADRSGRDVRCAPTTGVISGGIDLDGDLSGTDDGQLEGLLVTGGLLQDPAGGAYSGVIDGVVFLEGRADLDGSGAIEDRTREVVGDTGSIPLAGMTGAGGNGDCLLGGEEADPGLYGGLGADYVDAGAGDDRVVRGGAGNDLVRGGEGLDLVTGDEGDDLVAGDGGDDELYGDADDDVLRGGSGRDLLAGGGDTADEADGDDEVLGDGEDDVVVGGNARFSDTETDGSAIPDRGLVLLGTPGSDDDAAYGGYGDDWVLTQAGDDAAYGGPGTDVVEGGPGSDRVQGDDGEDLLTGGSSTTGAVTTTRTAAGTPDGDDTVVGDEGVDGEDGADVLVGDNARLEATGDGRERWDRLRPEVEVVLFDEPTSSAPSGSTSGDDVMRAGGEDDLVLAQSGDDTVEAGDGDDGVEGGAGGDTVRGGEGDDEVVGGSWIAGSYDADARDDLSGDAGDDLLLGDNGTPVHGGSPYVVLHDAPAAGAAPSAPTYGGDRLSGGAGTDLAFGQAGDDDLTGEEGVDALEGGPGADGLDGGTEDDVLVGGSSSSDGEITPDRSATGVLDDADDAVGGTGDDVVAGDNARIEATGGTRADGTALRTVLLFDLATATQGVPTDVGGDDDLAGDDGRDLVFGQAGDDTASGGDEDDYVEGGAGADGLSGGGGEDDLLGGGSTTTGAVIAVSGSSLVDRLLTAPSGATDSSAAALVDGNDTLDGGAERDVLLGDNGRVTRDGPNRTLAGGASGVHVVRRVAMADPTPGVWAGSDALLGGSGDDDLYGQFDNTRTIRPLQTYRGAPVPGDVLDGGVGEDALVGDQGVDVPTPAESLGAVDLTVSDSSGFIRERVRPRGTLVRVVTLSQSTLGGDDLLLGADGVDSLHAGAGNDTLNAGVGDDVVFGGDGTDALWGGTGHDRVFGGSGSDLLDVKRRTSDSRLRQVAAPTEDTDRRRRTLNGRDVLYGGSGPDALQADQGDEGSTRRVQGDRLIDWRSRINYYKVCSSGYGPGRVSNTGGSSMVSALQQLALAGGSVGPTELAIPGNERLTTYPNTGSFVCETG
ncbi:calcium-binding protein [uncultured Nocardioides sp.]|uniref:calcium-binding protein n=1 Tax=uncultured Nocardioides sp. TaxID=198441 RepID=UPI002602C3B5|nr:calcium-binding protein [uncultured Nocardioides sp.]